MRAATKTVEQVIMATVTAKTALLRDSKPPPFMVMP
jgi:hypothetical protein